MEYILEKEKSVVRKVYGRKKSKAPSEAKVQAEVKKAIDNFNYLKGESGERKEL